jgi:hypothetical protein
MEFDKKPTIYGHFTGLSAENGQNCRVDKYQPIKSAPYFLKNLEDSFSFPHFLDRTRQNADIEKWPSNSNTCLDHSVTQTLMCYFKYWLEPMIFVE